MFALVGYLRLLAIALALTVALYATFLKIRLI